MRLLFSACLLFLSFSAFCQEFELGNVKLEELEEKFHPSDSAAPAAVLYKRGKTYFEPAAFVTYLITDVEVRIKIYTKEGYEYAEKAFMYYSGGRPAYSFSDAATYNAVNGAVQVTKLGPDGEFTEQVSAYRTLKKIVLPNVREGSIIEYKYRHVTPYYFSIPDWNFQYAIPANHVEYEVMIPGYYSYRNFLRGNADVVQGQRTVKTKSYAENVLTYTANNVKALKEEAYVDNLSNYMSAVKHELIAIKHNGELKKFSTDWKTVTKRFFESEGFGQQLEFSGYYKSALNDIKDLKLPREETIKHILDHVKNHMMWNERIDITCDVGVKKAYKERTGNSAEINLILIAMLRDAGLMAHPVILSTRSNGLANYPSLDLYDYIIAGVETKEGIVLLDATSKNAVPGILPSRALNTYGRLIKEDGRAVEVSLVPVSTSKKVVSISASIEQNSGVSGTLKNQLLDYHAFNHMEAYGTLPTDIYVDILKKTHSNIDIKEYNRSQNDSLRLVVEQYDFNDFTNADFAGDKIYLNPLMFLGMKENPFKLEKREYPVDFEYPSETRYVITINIPEEYSVESLPSSTYLLLGNSIGSFKYQIAATDSQVQILVQLNINNAQVLSEEYNGLKEFFRKVVEKESEQIVFKRNI